MFAQNVSVRDEVEPRPDAQPFVGSGLSVSLWGMLSGLGTSRIMDRSTQEWMASFAVTLGVKAIYAINGEECNTRVVRAAGEYFPTHAWFDRYGVEVLSGAMVDGLYALESGRAFWMRTGDCPTIVVVYPSGKMAALHAGRRSLLPDGWQSGRLSVIQNLSQRMPLDGARVYLVCGVGPKSYPVPDDHPTYGASNAALRHDVAKRWGRECVRETDTGPSLSLIDIARAQLMSCGVAEDNIHWDGIDTVADRDAEGNFVWASTVRGDRERNHVLVANIGR